MDITQVKDAVTYALGEEVYNRHEEIDWVLLAQVIANITKDECIDICEGLHDAWHIGDVSGPRECAIKIKESVYQ